MVEIKFLSIWVPIILSIIAFIGAIIFTGLLGGGDFDFTGCFTVPFGIIVILVIWIVYFAIT